MLWHNGILLLSLCTCILGTNHTLNTLKSHLAQVAAVHHAEKLPFVLSNDINITLDTNSKVLKALQEYEKAISNLGSDVNLSPSQIVQQIFTLISSKEQTRLSSGTENNFGNVFLVNSAVEQNDTENLAFVGTRLGFTETKEAAQAGKLIKLLSRFAGLLGNNGDVELNTFYIPKSIQTLQKTSGAFSKNKAITDIITTSIDLVSSAESLDKCKHPIGDNAEVHTTTPYPIKGKEHNEIVDQFKLGIQTEFKHGMFDFQSGTKEHEKFAHEISGNFDDSVSYFAISENVVYHSLKQLSEFSTRIGNVNISNVFDVFVPGWSIVGGDKHDQFILHSPYVSHIDGQNGTDTLKFCPNIIETVMVDLTSEKYKSIEKVIGVAGVPLTVHAACDTKLVATKGGSNTTVDRVIIKNQTCLLKPLQTTVVASGNTNIEIEKEIKGNDSVHILVDGTQQGKLNFSLSVKSNNTHNLFVTIFLNDAYWFIKSTNCSKTSPIVSVELEEHLNGSKTGGNINLAFCKNFESLPSSKNVLPFSVQFKDKNSTVLRLVIDAITCTPKLFYEMLENKETNNFLKYYVNQTDTYTNVSQEKQRLTLQQMMKFANITGYIINPEKANKLGETTDYFSYDNQNTTVNMTCDDKQTTGVNKTVINRLSSSLENISSIWFRKDLQTIFYTIRGYDQNFSHKMVSSPNITDLFYPQLNFITFDGFEIKVGRDGSIWAISGKQSTHKAKFHLLALQRLANRLAVTILIQTPESFYFIDHSKLGLVGKRNVLQNIANMTTHLAGGGEANTIFEIVGLDSNIYLHTGFLDADFDEWKIQRNNSKQTIDLNYIVMPIRIQSQTKYIPSVEAEDDALVVTMKGYGGTYPGKIFILNGTKPWVAQRIQLLLHHSLMDLVQLNSSQPNSTNSTGSENKWIVQPRRLALTDDINIYSVTPEDIEDNQKIVLDSFKMNANPGNYTDVKFQAVQNENDLHLTNLKNVGSLGAKTVIIGGFYEHSNSLSGAKVTLLGLSVVLDGINIYQVENGSAAALMPTVYSEMHDDVLENVETKLLENLPNIQKPSKRKDDTMVIIVSSSGLLFVVGILCITLMLRLRKKGIYFVSSGKKACCVP